MKRGFLLLFLAVLLVLPVVRATIVIDSSLKDQYNLGEQISIAGHVSRDADFKGLFSLEFICDGDSFLLPVTSLELQAGQRENFPQDFDVPKIVVPSSLKGTCAIKAALLDGEVLEETTSDIFKITQDLEGTFSIDETRVQLGSSFTLNGEIFRLNGEGVDGSTEVYFEGGGSRFLFDIVNVQGGKFVYTYEPKSIPSGEYDIDLFVNDVRGNKKLFDNTVGFMLVNELYVFAKTEESSVNPGSKVKIFGESKTILQDDVNGGVVTIEVGEQKIITNLKNGEFDHEFDLSEKIKSGRHFITVTVEDGFGNKGVNEVSLFVNQKPTSLMLDFNNESLNPGDVLEIEPILYDQAGEIISNIVSIEIRDPDNNLIFSDSAPTNEKVFLSIDSFAEPGKYIITSSIDNLAKEFSFVVGELTSLDIVLMNQTLFIENKGNIVYKDPINIELNNGVYKVSKRVSLDPEENFTLLLNEEFPAGQYNLEVSYSDGLEEFTDVIITGKEALSFNIIYVILSIVAIALLIFIIVYGKKYRRKWEVKREKVMREARHSRSKLMKLKKKRSVRKWLESKEEDMDDFKDRVLREIKDTEKKSGEMAKSRKGSFYTEPEKKEKKEEKNLFRMFD